MEKYLKTVALFSLVYLLSLGGGISVFIGLHKGQIFLTILGFTFLVPLWIFGLYRYIQFRKDLYREIYLS